MTITETEPDREQQSLRSDQLAAARELQRLCPTDDARLILGTVFHEQGDRAAAIRCWRQGMQLPPSQEPLLRSGQARPHG